jgi:hypothetical protein
MPYVLRPGQRAWRSTKFIDLTGHKYGRWTVLKMAPRRGALIFWECVCECGVVKEIRGCNLRSGISKSCGCLNYEVIHGVDHGMTGSREYGCWINMRDRCSNPKNTHWKMYGGRGITVCQRWQRSFHNFYADMGPSNGLTIERIDVNGNYEPDNCKWIPASEQAWNKTNSRKIIAFGEEKLFIEWARFLDIDASLLHYHLRTGKTMEYIIEERKPVKKLCFCGESFFSIKEDQRFCSRKCMQIERGKRRNKEKQEREASQFLVTKGEGKLKRYARRNKPPTTGFKWIESKMWATKFLKEDAEKVAQQLGDGATIEQRGLFVRVKEYANMPIEKTGNGKLVARWRAA